MEAAEHAEIEASLSRITGELAAITRRLTGNPTDDLLARFVAERLHRVAGCHVSFTDLWGEFRRWLPEHERKTWSKARLLQRLGTDVSSRGRTDQPQKIVKGLTWTPPAEASSSEPANPNFNLVAMATLFRTLQDGGMSFEAIANHANESGLRDRSGDRWSAREVEIIWAD